MKLQRKSHPVVFSLFTLVTPRLGVVLLWLLTCCLKIQIVWKCITTLVFFSVVMHFFLCAQCSKHDTFTGKMRNTSPCIFQIKSITDHKRRERKQKKGSNQSENSPLNKYCPFSTAASCIIADLPTSSKVLIIMPAMCLTSYGQTLQLITERINKKKRQRCLIKVYCSSLK